MKLASAFQNYTDIHLSLLGLFLFLMVFVGTILWTGIKHNQLRYEKMASDILDDGERPSKVCKNGDWR